MQAQPRNAGVHLKLEFASLAGRRAFVDKVGRPVEGQTDDMIRALPDLDVRSKTELKKIAKRTEALRTEEACREEAQKAAEERRRAVAELEAEATSWVHANNLRAYIAAIGESAENLSQASKVVGWIDRAEAHVDSIDPMKRRLAALLNASENERPFVGT